MVNQQHADIPLVALDSITSFLDNGDSVCAAFIFVRHMIPKALRHCLDEYPFIKFQDEN